MPADDNRRVWDRLSLAIPVFVRGVDLHGRNFTELAVAVNISAGGALVALRRPVRPSDTITIQMPQPPLPELAQEAQSIEAAIVRSTPTSSYHLIGVKFARSILEAAERVGHA